MISFLTDTCSFVSLQSAWEYVHPGVLSQNTTLNIIQNVIKIPYITTIEAVVCIAILISRVVFCYTDVSFLKLVCCDNSK